MVQTPSLKCGRKKGLCRDSMKLVPCIVCGERAGLGILADAG